MATETVQKIIKTLNTATFQDLDRFYLAVGEEIYFVDKIISLLKTLALKEGIEIESYIIGVENQSFENFLISAYSDSLFSSSKLILIRGAESIKQEETEKFLKFIKNSKTNLTFMHVLKEDKRKKTFKNLRASSTNFDIKTQTTRTIGNWISFIAQEKGLNLNTTMLNLLEAKLGTDLQLINNELEKLKNYISDKELTVDIIKDFINSNTVVSVFDFLEAFFAKNKKKYLKYLYLLEASGDNVVMVLALLMNRLSKLILVKNDIDKDKVRLNPYYLRKLKSESNNFTYQELLILYKKLIFIDRKLKSSKLGFNLLYELVF